jgi:hypothetical protein
MAPGNGTEFYVGQEKAERRLKRPQNRSNDPSTRSLYVKTAQQIKKLSNCFEIGVRSVAIPVGSCWPSRVQHYKRLLERRPAANEAGPIAPVPGNPRGINDA